MKQIAIFFSIIFLAYSYSSVRAESSRELRARQKEEKRLLKERNKEADAKYRDQRDIMRGQRKITESIHEIEKQKQKSFHKIERANKRAVERENREEVRSARKFLKQKEHIEKKEERLGKKKPNPKKTFFGRQIWNITHKNYEKNPESMGTDAVSDFDDSSEDDDSEEGTQTEAAERDADPMGCAGTDSCGHPDDHFSDMN